MAGKMKEKEWEVKYPEEVDLQREGIRFLKVGLGTMGACFGNSLTAFIPPSERDPADSLGYKELFTKLRENGVVITPVDE